MRTPRRTLGGSSVKTDAQNEVSLPSSGGCWDAIAENRNVTRVELRLV